MKFAELEKRRKEMLKDLPALKRALVMAMLRNVDSWSVPSWLDHTEADQVPLPPKDPEQLICVEVCAHGTTNHLKKTHQSYRELLETCHRAIRQRDELRKHEARRNEVRSQRDHYAELVERAVRNARPAKGSPRWAAVKSTFGIGSTRAHKLCERFGLDPDEVGR